MKKEFFSFTINNNFLYKGEVVPPIDLDGCRSKYVFGEYIVKVDTCDEQPQTEFEVKVFQSLDKEDQQYFAPLILWDLTHNYVVQKFMDLIPPLDKIDEDTVILVRRLAKKYDLWDVMAGDFNHNWAFDRKTGQPIIFDYGL